MTEERILTAVERIDGALGRIELAARRTPDPQPHRDSAELEALRARHAAMRGQVEAAMGEIDTLIRNG
ncbi:MAG TPA: hypothetical protein VEZ48_14560 [Sphingomonadaceae bacterium]|nr:hypothetical protein [Sphingomonadaceae bacterium]